MDTIQYTMQYKRYHTVYNAIYIAVFISSGLFLFQACTDASPTG